MATIEVEIASRRYAVACRDGEEEHLREMAAVVDRKAKEAASALGSLPEARQLLFASLLLADEIKERDEGKAPPPAAEPSYDPAVANALEQLAERMEKLADRLESGRANT
ncbi:MAG TPA: cell division protein ZapA [Allosphingosinicella sp.]|uniref:cell division protein ZapA n=1 Tax=Allosphingosinicella sp. TaxID=2823234 RepID=UPI002EDB408F